MIILEIISEFIIEVIFIDIIGGILSRLNNAVLKLRGIETKSLEEIKLEKLRKRYEYKTIALKSNYNNLLKGDKGVVLELTDTDNAFIEFDGLEDILTVPIKDIQIKKSK